MSVKEVEIRKCMKHGIWYDLKKVKGEVRGCVHCEIDKNDKLGLWEKKMKKK